LVNPKTSVTNLPPDLQLPQVVTFVLGYENAMRHLQVAVLTVGCVFAAVAPARADDAKAARAVIDKAIKAHGGSDALKKFQGSVSTFKGTFRGMGMELPMTGEISMSGPSQAKVAIEIDAGGQKFSIVNVVNGKKGWTKLGDAVMELDQDAMAEAIGWTKLGDAVMELDQDAMAEAIEKQHAGWVASLSPLVEGKGYTLATTGEQMVGETKVIGIKVTTHGRRDVDLYFNKETGLLVKYEVRVKDEGSGQEVLEETVQSDYKEIQGTKQAMKLTTKRDGKAYLDIELSDVQLSEKLDDGVFVKP
jgi:hypothetical protein